MKQPAVYILASARHGTLYVGVTSDLARRVEAHRCNTVEGFTKTHHVHTLVYFELHSEMYEAIQREKRLKNWNRAWKIRLIELGPRQKHSGATRLRSYFAVAFARSSISW